MSTEPKLCTFCDLQPGHSGPHSWHRDDPTPPRDLADALSRISLLQSYLDKFADALADRDKKLERVRDYAQTLRDLGARQVRTGRPYASIPYDNTAAAFERIIGGQQ